MSQPPLLSLEATHAAAVRIIANGNRGATSASVVETSSLAAWLDLLVHASGGAERVEHALLEAGLIKPHTEEGVQS